ncbi:agmatinase family protein [Fulvivirga sp. RKSG066]|uniref:agmatinase family protein n=1 Tax=Fulvivirga aurantia TaxID=2529383 RepID=UPI0012BC8FB0|nr:agmatinase family protein [Fulvivirga aurantia]MTI21025.1 agmatinase family protein [Fulvivirga aurantia]
MQSKEEIIASFDPNGVAAGNALFGLPFGLEHSDLVIIPVPWEVTVSYNAGTADAPNAILEASTQVDLFIKDIPDAWQMGIHLLDTPESFQEENRKYRDLAVRYINWLETNEEDWISDELKVIPKAVDEVSEKLAIYIKSQAMKWMGQGKLVGLLGGDHSTPLGMIKAMSATHETFGILQIDAHADLREAYEDFTYSHASIMYNAMQIKNISRLVQIGIRDFCEEEMNLINKSNGRIVTYFDEDLKQQLFEGETWKSICDSIIDKLPQKVYISFDIDGLEPRFCPNTGTPVPGGLTYEQVIYLFKQLVNSGRVIIGFDLNEVSPGESEWDANVGARLLWQMSCLMGASQGKLQLKA